MMNDMEDKALSEINLANQENQGMYITPKYPF